MITFVRKKNACLSCDGSCWRRSVPAPRKAFRPARKIFAIGDVRAKSVKRVAAAVGEGSQVVAALHSFLAADAPGQWTGQASQFRASEIQSAVGLSWRGEDNPKHECDRRFLAQSCCASASAECPVLGANQT
jgi:hypothetical protein